MMNSLKLLNFVKNFKKITIKRFEFKNIKNLYKYHCVKISFSYYIFLRSKISYAYVIF